MTKVVFRKTEVAIAPTARRSVTLWIRDFDDNLIFDFRRTALIFDFRRTAKNCQEKNGDFEVRRSRVGNCCRRQARSVQLAGYRPWRIERGPELITQPLEAFLPRGGVLIMTQIHSLPAEWLPVSISPPDRDLEVCVMDFDGIVLALAYPCHKDGADWVDASNEKRVDIQPTHWRKWTESP